MELFTALSTGPGDAASRGPSPQPRMALSEAVPGSATSERAARKQNAQLVRQLLADADDESLYVPLRELDVPVEAVVHGGSGTHPPPGWRTSAGTHGMSPAERAKLAAIGQRVAQILAHGTTTTQRSGEESAPVTMVELAGVVMACVPWRAHASLSKTPPAKAGMRHWFQHAGEATAAGTELGPGCHVTGAPGALEALGAGSVPDRAVNLVLYAVSALAELNAIVGDPAGFSALMQAAAVASKQLGGPAEFLAPRSKSGTDMDDAYPVSPHHVSGGSSLRGSTHDALPIPCVPKTSSDPRTSAHSHAATTHDPRVASSMTGMESVAPMPYAAPMPRGGQPMAWHPSIMQPPGYAAHQWAMRMMPMQQQQQPQQPHQQHQQWLQPAGFPVSSPMQHMLPSLSATFPTSGTLLMQSPAGSIPPAPAASTTAYGNSVARALPHLSSALPQPGLLMSHAGMAGYLPSMYYGMSDAAAAAAGLQARPGGKHAMDQRPVAQQQQQQQQQQQPTFQPNVVPSHPPAVGVKRTRDSPAV